MAEKSYPLAFDNGFNIDLEKVNSLNMRNGSENISYAMDYTSDGKRLPMKIYENTKGEAYTTFIYNEIDLRNEIQYYMNRYEKGDDVKFSITQLNKSVEPVALEKYIEQKLSSNKAAWDEYFKNK